MILLTAAMVVAAAVSDFVIWVVPEKVPPIIFFRKIKDFSDLERIKAINICFVKKNTAEIADKEGQAADNE